MEIPFYQQIMESNTQCVCVCVLGVAEVYALKYAFKKKSSLLLQVSSPLSNC